jgi:hypothetical protein
MCEITDRLHWKNEYLTAVPSANSCHSAMSEGVQRCYQLAEVCRDRAAQARNSIDAEAWLKLAEDWLELARADGQSSDNRAPTSAASD